MKIGFDFDGTLARRRVKELAVQLIRAGNEVWIISSRSPEDRNVGKVFEVAERLNLSSDRVIFTDGQPKFYFLKDFDMHFDNNAGEIDLISGNIPSCACFLVNDYKS